MANSSTLALALALILFATIQQFTSAHHFSPEDFVDAHNAARDEAGVKFVEWDWKLAKYAKNHAEKQKGDCWPIKYSHDHNYGENIFWGKGNHYTEQDVVDSWTSEKEYYNYSDNSCEHGKECGHYKQVVWGKTKKIGCAWRKCKRGVTYVVCEYYPKGNVEGAWPF